MKKLFMSFLFLWVFSAFIFAEDYSFVALGDIHFDGEAYHTSAPKHEYQLRERKRNIGMWNSGKSAEVLTAASKKVTPDMPFVIQLGDFTQGDCDTPELQEQMFIDAFSAVKKFFPDTKLLPVKGNHDIRILDYKGDFNLPAANAFLPLIAKELGRDKISDNYTVRHGKDVYIFFDSFVDGRKSLDFVRKALEENKDARYIFFLTHLPVLACSTSYPAWTIPQRRAITALLAERNAVILSAHTHVPSFISLENSNGKLSQLTVTSMGNQWKPNGKPKIDFDTYEKYRAKIKDRGNNKTALKNILDDMDNSKIFAYEYYSAMSGFIVIHVNDREVRADIYANNSGNPWRQVILRKNDK